MFIKDKWDHILDTHSIKTPLSTSDLVKHTHTEFIKLMEENDLEVREGFWALARELKVDKNIKMGLVTNTVREVAVQVLSHLELETSFDAVVCADDVKKPKPDPQMYKQAAKLLGVKPKEILVFEDSVVGAESAVKAGMNVVIIWDSKTNKNLFPESVREYFPDFRALPGNLDETFIERYERTAKEAAERALDDKN
jgi:HAD superfamily hydrolase (TIGR01509 family)